MLIVLHGVGVAELGAAFLSPKLDVTVEPRADHAKYIAIWIKFLQSDLKTIVTAANKAAEAADYLLAFQQIEKQEAA